MGVPLESTSVPEWRKKDYKEEVIKLEYNFTKVPANIMEKSAARRALQSYKYPTFRERSSFFIPLYESIIGFKVHQRRVYDFDGDSISWTTTCLGFQPWIHLGAGGINVSILKDRHVWPTKDFTHPTPFSTEIRFLLIIKYSNSSIIFWLISFPEKISNVNGMNYTPTYPHHHCHWTRGLN